MLLSELNESKFGNSLAALGLAAGVANANTSMRPIHGFDTRYGAKTPTMFQQRYNHDIDADNYNYKLSQEPDKFLERPAPDSVDIENTVEKILATPDSILTKYGKNNVEKLAKYAVESAHHYDIDINILLAVLSTETGFNQDAVSHTGVRSIAQITTSTFNSLQDRGKIDQHHNMEKIKTDPKAAIHAAADIINYFSKHMHNNIEMIFAEYNGGTNGGASPYRMYRQGVSKEKIINWMRNNDCSEKTIKHFFTETIPYVSKCLKAYKYYLSIDEQE